MTNKKKSVKNQKKKTPQKMFAYRKRGDKKGKQNKTSKRTMQGGDDDKETPIPTRMSRVDKLYNTENDNIPMENMMKDLSPDMMKGLSPEMVKGLSPDMMKGLSPDMMKGLSPQSSTPMPQVANTNTPDDPYKTALAEQKVKIDVAVDTVTKEISDALCQTINRSISSVIHYKILGSTVLTQKEINTIGKFFNVDADKLSDELNIDRDIKIGDKVSFPDETMKDIITKLFDTPNSREILYDSIPRIVNELDLVQVFYNMNGLDDTNSKSDSDIEETTLQSDPLLTEGGDNADNDADGEDIISTESVDEDEDNILHLKATPLGIDDEIVALDTSEDERLLGLKSSIHDKVFSKVVELLNKEEDGLTLLERQLTNFVSNEKFSEKISDIIVAKISYLITDLGTQVIYKTLTENQDLVPLLKDVLQSMDAIKTLEDMLRDEENKKEKKNNQKLSIIAELIEELKVKARTAANKYITTSTNKDESMSQEDQDEDAVVDEKEEEEEKEKEKEKEKEDQEEDAVVDEKEKEEEEEKEEEDQDQEEDEDEDEREVQV